jgi:DNA repair protein RecO (recombination protein O)
MIENASGIILRTRPFTETSLTVHWLTPDLGRLSTVAKGARRPRSPFQGKLDLFYLADFSFLRSRRSELHTLREVSLKDSRQAIRQQFDLLQHASYAAALIEQATEIESPLPAIFCMLNEFLRELERRAAKPALIFAFELKLLNELGLQPDLAESTLSAGSKEIARNLEQKDFAFASLLKLMRAQFDELRQFLQGFLVFHLGKVPKSRAAAVKEDDSET